jgi:hypothetical protein
MTAPLQIDASTMHGFIKGQMISPMDRPDFARHVITNDVSLAPERRPNRGNGSALRAGDVVKLLPPTLKAL